MRKVLMAVAATAALGAFGLSAPASAETRAAPVKDIVAALKDGSLQTSYVQWRGGHYYDNGRPYYGRRYYGRPYGYNRPHRYYRRDRGDALAAGALGLAAGAIIGGALAQQQAQAAAPTYVAPNQSAVAYCMRRFRSYDPRSGTYLGYDGLRHPCP